MAAMPGQLVREGRHRCQLPFGRWGEIWRCECGWRWVAVLDARSPNGIAWRRKLWPWPR